MKDFDSIYRAIQAKTGSVPGAPSVQDQVAALVSYLENDDPFTICMASGETAFLAGTTVNDQQPLPNFRNVGITREAGSAIPEEMDAFIGATRADGKPVTVADYFSTAALLANNNLLVDRSRSISAIELAQLARILQTRSKSSDTMHNRNPMDGHFRVINPDMGMDTTAELHKDSPLQGIEPYVALTARLLFPMATPGTKQAEAVEAVRTGRIYNLSMLNLFQYITCGLCGSHFINEFGGLGEVYSSLRLSPARDVCGNMLDCYGTDYPRRAVIRTPDVEGDEGFFYDECYLTWCEDDVYTIQPTSALRLGPGSQLLMCMDVPPVFEELGICGGPKMCPQHGMEGSRTFDGRLVVGMFTKPTTIVNVSQVDAGAVSDARIVLHPDCRY
jgi:hypothetical protein